MPYSNEGNIPLSVAVMLATDNYDHSDQAISATQLLKPTRQLILDHRIPQENKVADLMGLAASRYGTAIHDAIERAWMDPSKALTELGYKQSTIDKIRINPTKEEVEAGNVIPVYMEQRWERETLGGYFVSGKADFVFQGQLEDFKTTTTYSYMDPQKDWAYAGQGSIYRWIKPDIITSNTINITQMFLDWSAGKAKQGGLYPPQRIISRSIPLWSLGQTDQFIKGKIKELTSLIDEDEDKLPLCTDADLWRKPTVWKYYKNPEKRQRSSGNYDTAEEARQRVLEEGTGIVEEFKGKAVACRFCSAISICSQAKRMIEADELDLG